MLFISWQWSGKPDPLPLLGSGDLGPYGACEGQEQGLRAAFGGKTWAKGL